MNTGVFNPVVRHRLLHTISEQRYSDQWVSPVCGWSQRVTAGALLLLLLLFLFCPSASSSFILLRTQAPGDMSNAAPPKRQDTRKFFENLSGDGKSIAVLTSGGDAQGTCHCSDF